jgi:curved DNA-binding protein CbpA/GGDEF domain-containing protein
MAKWEDYYSILQVHYRAEADIISSAYKRLSKKYHPDVNRSAAAAETMKRINVAYGVLSDASKRAAYNAEWRMMAGGQRHGVGGFGMGGGFGAGGWTDVRDGSGGAAAGDGYGSGTGYGNGAGGGSGGAAGCGGRAGAAPGWDGRAAAERGDCLAAAEVLCEYFRHIEDRDYELAYECISPGDKKNIKKPDFIEWQSAVGGAVELRSAAIRLFRRHIGKRLGKKSFAKAVEYNVRICERDMAGGAFSEYTASKSVVLEDGRWGVYLGYRNIKPFIEKYAGRDGGAAGAVKAAELLQDYNARHDGVTGILNFSGFADAAAAEVSRSRRYGNIFSVAAFEVRHFGGSAPFRKTARFAAKILVEALRDIDIACRWKDMRFLALMPETGAAAARRAANRVCCEFNRQMLAAGAGASGQASAGAGAGRGAGAAKGVGASAGSGPGAGAGGGCFAIFAGTSQFDMLSLDSTLKRCASNLRVAGRLRRARPVSGLFASRRKYRIPKYFSVKYT